MAALVITEATGSEELFGIIKRSWCLGESVDWVSNQETRARPFTSGGGVGQLSVQKADSCEKTATRSRGDHS